MGYEARLNPRSIDGGKDARGVLDAQFRRFCAFFQTRSEYEQYLLERDVTEPERCYLDSLLPERLRVMD